MLEISLIISAFIAGVVTFLAPCTLPLVPAYLGFISGAKEDEVRQAEGNQKKVLQRKILKNGFFFVLGFSVVFILFGSLIGFLGASLIKFRNILTQIAGVFVIVFGLMMLDVIKVPYLQREHKFRMPTIFRKGSPAGSFAIGASFGFGWTPCVGPVLAAILVLAGTTGTVGQGALLLFVFSIGLSIPFLLTAIVLGRATEYIQKMDKYIKWMSFVGGIVLIFLGVLLLMNNFVVLIEYGYKLLEFIDYDSIQRYL